MTDLYSQTVEVAVSKRAKALQWIGIASVLISLGFLMCAIFYSWYFVFALLFFASFGITDICCYNAFPREYTYEFTPDRLTVIKKDILGKQSRVLTLMTEDIMQFELMEGLASDDDDDVTACSDTSSQGVFQIVYREGESVRRLLFEPDDYMQALLNEKLGD